MARSRRNAESKVDRMPSPQRIRVPVRFVDGHWELAYGSAIKVANGSAAELAIARNRLDPDLLKALTAKRWVKILEEGTELRIALTIRTVLSGNASKVMAKAPPIRPECMGKLSDQTSFVPVVLGPATKAQRRRKELKGGLWLALEGAEPRALESSEVFLPGLLGLDPAISVNHAFTRLSEIFEPWRMSHTGSIYERVFYKEHDDYWYPLDDLRNKELAAAEREILRTLWLRVRLLFQAPL